MKKTIFFIVLALLCLNFRGMAQDVDVLDRRLALRIGDRVPDLLFDRVLNGDRLPIRLSDFKGKSVILDFWGIWCGACIASFPHSQELQNKYGRNLQILLVNDTKADTEVKILDFLRKRDLGKESVLLPVILDSGISPKLFPHYQYPHYVWIGSDRRVKAYVKREAMTEKNIERLIAGLDLYLPIKEF